ncbi:hypothetical protein Zmor_012284 [Zophobas morio]|uniref:tRNA uridine 5-carboxymethylaminomethyl modification enzyme C-terminal subdomain domain-containing protein n=1 Tax=Zophobas morio TaxID=2755281 RepID=A0AA38HI19_9CUCU|nr:hypothetical protein Zmor_012284 [Zophobas morio]
MDVANELRDLGQSNLQQGFSVYEIIKQPTVDVDVLKKYFDVLNNLTETQLQNLIINIRFDGYIKKELETVDRFEKLEQKMIPTDLNYDDVDSLATEAREKLKKVRPVSIGQASRISGVNPADIQMLLIHLRKKYVSSQE